MEQHAPGTLRDVPSYQPMLATAGDSRTLRDGPQWAFEMKWDGYRCLVHIADGRARLLSRNGNDFTPTFPDLVEPLLDAVLVDDAVLDGEIVTVNRDGRPDFGLLQTRGTITRPTEAARAASKTPAQLLLFDALAFDGHDLTGQTYDERRKLLAGLIDPNPVVHVPEAFEGDAKTAIATSRELGLEGIIAKERSSTYLPGRRSPAWVKYKNVKTQEVAIIGWREGSHGEMAALILGVPDSAGRLRYAGRVGTGFTDRQRRDIAATLRRQPKNRPHATGVSADAARGAHWVRPDLVGEVVFLEWTKSGTLRHPSWRGWRHDKTVADIIVEP